MGKVKLSSSLSALCFMILGFYSLEGWAVRKLPVFPIGFQSAHGGIKTIAGVPQSCSSMGMPAPGLYSGGTGVMNSYHLYAFQFRNHSSIAQNLIAIIKPGTGISSQYSSSACPGCIDSPGASVRLSTQVLRTLPTIPANGYATYLIAAFCSYAQCFLTDSMAYVSGLAIVGTAFAYTAEDPLVSKVCLTTATILQVEFEVQEDRGALTGSVSGAAHRAWGQVDQYVTPPPMFPLNGGLPF